MGKKLTVFLVDGTEYGPRTVEIGNWSGKALYTPRSSANEFLNRTEFDSCGIYILKSVPESDVYLERIYIGEAEVLRKRIREHLKDTDKDFFTELVAFTSHILTKAHIRYLESKIILLSKEAKTAQIENSNETSLPYLPEAEVSDMNYFLDQIKLILPLMGFRFLIPTVIKSTLKADDKEHKTSTFTSIEKYRIKHASLIAYMTEDDKGYIVLKGSQANKTTSPSISPTYISLRQKLIEDGTLIDKGEYYEFTADAIFGSISPAANVVLGRQSNGNIEWVNEQGKTYKERQDEIFKPE